jgi:hypothetical protein
VSEALHCNFLAMLTLSEMRSSRAADTYLLYDPKWHICKIDGPQASRRVRETIGNIGKGMELPPPLIPSTLETSRDADGWVYTVVAGQRTTSP